MYQVMTCDTGPITILKEIICPTKLAAFLTGTQPGLHNSLRVEIVFTTLLWGIQMVKSIEFKITPNHSNSCTGIHRHLSTLGMKPESSKSDLTF